MLKIGNKVMRADATMEGTVLSVMWSKILKECPEYLRADLYERHDRTNMAAALNYIQQWISRHPDCSLHSKQLKKERERKPNGYERKNGNHPKTQPKVANIRALPPVEGWPEETEREQETIPSGEEDTAGAAALQCYGCKEEGHLRRDCPSGSQTQTVPIGKKSTTTKPKKTYRKGVNKFKENAKKDRCPICLKNWHPLHKCFLLKKILIIWKEIKNDVSVNFMELVAEDPFHEEVQPVREAIATDINWEATEIEEEDIDKVITAALECQELYNESSSEGE